MVKEQQTQEEEKEMTDKKKKSVVFTGEPLDYMVKAYLQYIDSIAYHVPFSHFVYSYFRKGWDPEQFKDDEDFLKYSSRLSDKELGRE